MRIRIVFDGAEPRAVRDMAAALSTVGLTGELKVGCDGPEKWAGETPSLTPNQFAAVVARLVKYHGVPFAEALANLNKE